MLPIVTTGASTVRANGAEAPPPGSGFSATKDVAVPGAGTTVESMERSALSVPTARTVTPDEDPFRLNAVWVLNPEPKTPIRCVMP